MARCGEGAGKKESCRNELREQEGDNKGTGPLLSVQREECSAALVFVLICATEILQRLFHVKNTKDVTAVVLQTGVCCCFLLCS